MPVIVGLEWEGNNKMVLNTLLYILLIIIVAIIIIVALQFLVGLFLVLPVPVEVEGCEIACLKYHLINQTGGT